jgi:hypothetical protein
VVDGGVLRLVNKETERDESEKRQRLRRLFAFGSFGSLKH